MNKNVIKKFAMEARRGVNLSCEPEGVKVRCFR